MAKTVVETFRRLAQFSSPSSVYAKQSVLAGAYEVEVVFNQRDLEKKQDTKFIKNYLLKPDSASLIDVGRPLDISSELWRAQSQTGKKIAVLRQFEQNKQDEKQMIEVWDFESRICTVDVGAQEKHGKVYSNDSVFGSLQFSNCEKYLLYIAEKKRKKSEAFLSPFGKQEENLTKDKTDPILKLEMFLFLKMLSLKEFLLDRQFGFLVNLAVILCPSSLLVLTVLRSVLGLFIVQSEHLACS